MGQEMFTLSGTPDFTSFGEFMISTGEFMISPIYYIYVYYMIIQTWDYVCGLKIWVCLH